MKSFKQYIAESHEDPDHPKNWSIVKMHKDDTGTGKHRWDIRDKKGEGDVIDSYEKRADAHHYLTKWRKGYTAQNTVSESIIWDKPVHTKTITADELLKHIGRPKMKSMAKHPFHQDYFDNVSNAGYQYHRDSLGHEHVLAAPVNPVKRKDGTEVRRMVKFDFYKRHVDNAHLFHNIDNRRHHPDNGGNRIWTHVRSHKEDEE